MRLYVRASSMVPHYQQGMGINMSMDSVVQEALKNYVSWMKKKQLLDLRGQVTWEGSLKEMRSL